MSPLEICDKLPVSQIDQKCRYVDGICSLSEIVKATIFPLKIKYRLLQIKLIAVMCS